MSLPSTPQLADSHPIQVSAQQQTDSQGNRTAVEMAVEPGLTSPSATGDPSRAPGFALLANLSTTTPSSSSASNEPPPDLVTNQVTVRPTNRLMNSPTEEKSYSPTLPRPTTFSTSISPPPIYGQNPVVPRLNLQSLQPAEDQRRMNPNVPSSTQPSNPSITPQSFASQSTSPPAVASSASIDHDGANVRPLPMRLVSHASKGAPTSSPLASSMASPSYSPQHLHQLEQSHPGRPLTNWEHELEAELARKTALPSECLMIDYNDDKYEIRKEFTDAHKDIRFVYAIQLKTFDPNFNDSPEALAACPHAKKNAFAEASRRKRHFHLVFNALREVLSGKTDPKAQIQGRSYGDGAQYLGYIIRGKYDPGHSYIQVGACLDQLEELAESIKMQIPGLMDNFHAFDTELKASRTRFAHPQFRICPTLVDAIVAYRRAKQPPIAKDTPDDALVFQTIREDMRIFDATKRREDLLKRQKEFREQFLRDKVEHMIMEGQSSHKLLDLRPDEHIKEKGPQWFSAEEQRHKSASAPITTVATASHHHSTTGAQHAVTINSPTSPASPGSTHAPSVAKKPSTTRAKSGGKVPQPKHMLRRFPKPVRGAQRVATVQFGEDETGFQVPECDCNLFVPYQNEELVRMLIEVALDNVLNTLDHDKSTGNGLRELKRRKVLKDIFPLHYEVDKRFYRQSRADVVDQFCSVTKSWVAAFSFLEKSRIFVSWMRDYFGEKIGMYFAFLHFYNNCTLYLALLGLGPTLYSYLDTADNISVVVYCIVIMLWAALFVKFWNRQSNDYAFEWNMLEYEAKEGEMDSFLRSLSGPSGAGNSTYGFYEAEGRWVDMTDFATRIKQQKEKGDAILKFVPKNHIDTSGRMPDCCLSWYGSNTTHGRMERAALNANIWRYVKESIGWSVITTLVGCVLSVIISLVFLKLVLSRILAAYGGVIAGVANGLSIFVLDRLYKQVAIKMTEWENHRTVTQFEEKLTSKCFVFQFVNSYFSLFYIAFFKSGYSNPSVFGYDDYCKDGAGNKDRTCMTELSSALMTIILTRLAIALVTQRFLPKYLTKLSLARLKLKAQVWEKMQAGLDFTADLAEKAGMGLKDGVGSVGKGIKGHASKGFGLAGDVLLLRSKKSRPGGEKGEHVVEEEKHPAAIESSPDLESGPKSPKQLAKLNLAADAPDLGVIIPRPRVATLQVDDSGYNPIRSPSKKENEAVNQINAVLDTPERSPLTPMKNLMAPPETTPIKTPTALSFNATIDAPIIISSIPSATVTASSSSPQAPAIPPPPSTPPPIPAPPVTTAAAASSGDRDPLLPFEDEDEPSQHTAREQEKRDGSPEPDEVEEGKEEPSKNAAEKAGNALLSAGGAVFALTGGIGDGIAGGVGGVLRFTGDVFDKINFLGEMDKMSLEYQAIQPKYAINRNVLGTFDDYNELVIGYGYMVMFAAAFPICPAITLAHNIIQNSTHGFKLIKNYQKPKYYGATDIGMFWYLLVFLTAMSVATNTAIICFTSGQLSHYFTDVSIVNRLSVAIILEHIFGLAVYLVLANVSDFRPSLRVQLAFNEQVKDVENDYAEAMELKRVRDEQLKKKEREKHALEIVKDSTLMLGQLKTKSALTARSAAAQLISGGGGNYKDMASPSSPESHPLLFHAATLPEHGRKHLIEQLPIPVYHAPVMDPTEKKLFEEWKQQQKAKNEKSPPVTTNEPAPKKPTPPPESASIQSTKPDTMPKPPPVIQTPPQQQQQQLVPAPVPDAATQDTESSSDSDEDEDIFRKKKPLSSTLTDPDIDLNWDGISLPNTNFKLRRVPIFDPQTRELKYVWTQNQSNIDVFFPFVVEELTQLEGIVVSEPIKVGSQVYRLVIGKRQDSESVEFTLRYESGPLPNFCSAYLVVKRYNSETIGLYRSISYMFTTHTGFGFPHFASLSELRSFGCYKPKHDSLTVGLVIPSTNWMGDVFITPRSPPNPKPPTEEAKMKGNRPDDEDDEPTVKSTPYGLTRAFPRLLSTEQPQQIIVDRPGSYHYPPRRDEDEDDDEEDGSSEFSPLTRINQRTNLLTPPRQTAARPNKGAHLPPLTMGLRTPVQPQQPMYGLGPASSSSSLYPPNRVPSQRHSPMGDRTTATVSPSDMSRIQIPTAMTSAAYLRQPPPPATRFGGAPRVADYSTMSGNSGGGTTPIFYANSSTPFNMTAPPAQLPPVRRRPAYGVLDEDIWRQPPPPPSSAAFPPSQLPFRQDPNLFEVRPAATGSSATMYPPPPNPYMNATYNPSMPYQPYGRQ